MRSVEMAAPATAVPGLDPSALDPAWAIVEEGFSLQREHEIESLLAVGNGYVGTRGALVEPTPLSFPATFIAGVFDRKTAEGMPELALGPDWTSVRLSVEGHTLRLDEGEPLAYRRVLDLRHGILRREWLHRDPTGRETWVRGCRFASLADRHVLVQSFVLTPANYTGRLRVEMRIELPRRHIPSEALAPPELVPSDPAGLRASPLAGLGSPFVLHFQTRHTDVRVAIASASRVEPGEGTQYRCEVGPGRAVERWEREVEIGQHLRFDRLVTVYTSREAEAPAEAALGALQTCAARGAAPLLTAHAAAWAARWEVADVAVEGDELAQRALRFAVYQLSSAVNPADERVSIGARGLTGDAYKGHVFWDTEIFMLPFYTYTAPAAARALLMYRAHTLAAARKKAADGGWRGALYAWESADTGEETTPTSVVGPGGQPIAVRTGELEQHISADIAYAVWQYWQVTGDDAFFRDAGAEIVIETARFWASRAQPERDGRYHIRTVIGPDEYHEEIDDNAFTNLMAQWNLETAVETCGILRGRWPEAWRRVTAAVGLEEDELDAWRRTAAQLAIHVDAATGLLEQFQGFFALDQIDLARFADRTLPLDVILGREVVQRAQIVKQADVVMALYLLWDRFAPDARAGNFGYYEPRTAHGSSLSPAIHAAVAARLGALPTAERYFRQAAEIDLGNNMGNASAGVHMAALGGLWQAAVMGFAGVRASAEGLAIDPRLPDRWRSLGCAVLWRGRRVEIRISRFPAQVQVAVHGTAPVPVRVAGGHVVDARPGESLVAPYSSA